MLEKQRGYNSIWLPWGMPFPENLQPSRGALPLTWDQFGAQLRVAGVTVLRVKFCGWNHPQGVQDVLSFEPRLGEWNDWGGRLGELVAMCEAHDIGLLALPFDRVEWYRDSAWNEHAWNTRNGGVLSDRRDVFRDWRTIDAAKRRIDAIVERAGHVISGWELVAEHTFMLEPPYFGTTWEGMRGVMFEEVVPWVEEMAWHIKGQHPGPVGNGIVFAPRGFDSIDAVRNEAFRAPGLDFATLNWYGNEYVGVKMERLRAAQDYTGLPVRVTQYAPWRTDGEDYVRDEDPFPRSKQHEWAAACGGWGVCGPLRWADYHEHISTWWGTAHPNMAAIAGTTTQFAEAVDLSDWNGRGESWDGRIASDALSFVASWGDGQHVTAYLDWENEGDKQVTVSGLTGPACLVTAFDYLSGEPTMLIGDVQVAEGTASFALPTTGTRGVFYLEPAGTPPPQEERVLRVRATLEVDGLLDGVFEGELVEVL